MIFYGVVHLSILTKGTFVCNHFRLRFAGNQTFDIFVSIGLHSFISKTFKESCMHVTALEQTY